MNISFFHLADIHLDSPYHFLAKKRGLPLKRRDEVYSCFLDVLLKAKREEPNFIFICGDLYEHNYTPLKRIKEINGLFESINSQIVLIAGNHDPLAKNSYYASFDWASNVHILGRHKSYVSFEEEKVRVYGIGYDTGGGQLEVLESFRIDPTYYNILLLHGDVDLSISTYNQVSSNKLEKIAFDYVALGHNHRMYKKDNVYNPGSLCALSFDQEGDHGYFKKNLEDQKAEFVKSDDRKFINLTLSLEEIKEFEKQYPSTRDFYRITLKGLRDDKQEVPEFSHYDFVEIIDETIEKKKEAYKNEAFGLKELFENLIKNKLDSTNSEEKEILNRALDLGKRALDKENLEELWKF